MKNPLLRAIVAAVPAAVVMLAVGAGQASAAQEPLSPVVSHGVSAVSAVADQARNKTEAVLDRVTTMSRSTQNPCGSASASGCDSSSAGACATGCSATTTGIVGLGVGIALPTVAVGVDLGNLLTVGLGVNLNVVNGLIVGYTCP